MHQIAPSVSRVAALFNPQTAPFAHYYLDSLRPTAAALAIEPIEALVHSTAAVEALVVELGSKSDAELIVLPDASAAVYGDTLRSAAERNRLPVIYWHSLLVAA